KLSRANVVQVRELLAQGVSHQELAQRFGVSRPAISHLASGHSYRSI
ncbi:MAG: helix-turn-helix domain-containing protein, partial [Hymenobacter sp.]